MRGGDGIGSRTSLATAASLLTLAGLSLYLVSSKEKEENESASISDDQARQTTLDDTGTHSATMEELQRQHLPRFPWEPDETKLTKGDVAHQNLRTAPAPVLPSDDYQQQQEQLNFLASMTFSNGGLRAPSCPCCQ